jgi:hypothetical protein
MLLVTAALLAGGVAIWERQPRPQADAPPLVEQVFRFAVNDVSLITVQTGPQVVSVERVNGQWQMSAPEKVPASEPTVSYLTNLLTSSNRDRVVTVALDRKAEFGLDNPSGTIVVTLNNQQKHQLILGKPTYDRTALYAQIDPDPQAKDLVVSLIPIQFIDAVTRPITEWQDKPKALPKKDAKPDEKAIEPAAPKPESSPMVSPAPASPTPVSPTPVSPAPSPSEAAASPSTSPPPSASPRPSTSTASPSPSTTPSPSKAP